MKERYLYKSKTCNGEWVTGLLAHKDNKYYISNKAGTPFAFEVRPDNICQCTGLKDKNGTLIWETDIVATPYIDPIFGDMVNDKILEDYTWKVLFIDGAFCVDNDYARIYLNSFYKNGCIKVLSNIFDNPELLEVE